MNLLIKIIALLSIVTPLMAEPVIKMMPGTFDCRGKENDDLETCKTNNMVACMKHGLNEVECAGMLNSDANIMIRVDEGYNVSM